ncbi:hypothetical protein HPB48_000274 [Haemaphysalis longicornis]|uniref:Uncharacterized protein n=1 Tax=Haemaphysalis longicornis TaxID=44386 RepID=A0A9J6FTH5_HAELO|nr:hypothetical protein HPB48_000274 [Haemaphysalis longicornis]
MSDGSDVSISEISSEEENDDVVIYGIEPYKFEPKAENSGQCESAPPTPPPSPGVERLLNTAWYVLLLTFIETLSHKMLTPLCPVTRIQVQLRALRCHANAHRMRVLLGAECRQGQDFPSTRPRLRDGKRRIPHVLPHPIHFGGGVQEAGTLPSTIP